MPDLNFQIEGVEAVAHAAQPQLIFKLRITNADPGEAIQNVGLRCQIQIQTTRRRYTPEDQARLRDLFGEPEGWSHTLRTLLWTHVNVVVPPFSGETVVDLPVPCTFDFNVAATKYFHGVADGEIPLEFLFSGTIFHRTEEGDLRVAQISWEKEAHFRLKVEAWQQMMDLYYPNSTWLRVRRDVFERLYQFKIRRGLPTWEETLDVLLDAAAAEVSP